MNPFKYGTVVSGRYFINRQREIARIKADLLGGNNIILFPLYLRLRIFA
jgi:hypothetical protein